MIVMPANNTCWLVSYWAGRYGGLAHLISPGRSYKPFPHLPYSLDNGRYAAHVARREWSAPKFMSHVEKYAHCPLRPSWMVVPDAVGDGELTLQMWREWVPRLERYNIPLALAVQDGMDLAHVWTLERLPDVLFVGGTTAWKWATVELWCRAFPRVHVGRVNGAKGLEICRTAGAESVDGSGYFRGRSQQILDLGEFLRAQSNPFGDSFEEVERVVRFSRHLRMNAPALPI